MKPEFLTCPVCRGERTHTVHNEERLCKFCDGKGFIPAYIALVVEKWKKRKKSR
jgi:RecJ-like exonuclease